MVPAKCNLLIALFAYSGNGGIASCSAEITKWLAKLTPKLHSDERIGQFFLSTISDTPIPMSRNLAVQQAQQLKCDFLLMLDSDMAPDILAYETKVEFWDSSFEFAYKRMLDGKPTVIASPYCGPPPGWQHIAPHNANMAMQESPPYIFRWYQRSDDPTQLELKMLSRTEAASLKGIQPMAALPTGMIIYSLSAFDLMLPPFFKYEWNDKFEAKKGSTEDCYNTREIGLAAEAKGLGNVLFANMDCWSGHIKVITVGRPTFFREGQVSETLKAMFLSNEEAKRLHDEGDGKVEISRAQPDLPKPEVKGPIPVFKKQRRIGRKKVFSLGHETPDNELEALQSIVEYLRVRRGRPLRIVEVGVWVGESAIAMAQANDGGVIYAVDHWMGNPNDAVGKVLEATGRDEVIALFKKNCGAMLGKQIKPLEGDSVEVANSFKEGQALDMIFIDAGHEKHEVLADLQAWIRHLAPGGVICGHDLCEEFPGVQEAVEEFFGSDRVKLYDGTSIWLVDTEETKVGLEKSATSGHAASAGSEAESSHSV